MELITQTQKKPKHLPALGHTAVSSPPRRDTIGYFIAGFVLCPISFGFGAVPLGICTLCACPMACVPAVTVALLLGYGLCWGVGGAFEMYVLLSAAICAKVLLRKNRKLMHPACVLASCLTGLSFAALQGFSGSAMIHWGIGLLCAGLGSLLADGIRRGDYPARIAGAALLVLGAYMVPLPAGLNLAALALGWIAGMSEALIFICAGSAAITLVHPGAAAECAALCAAGVCMYLLRGKTQILRVASAGILLVIAGVETKSYGFAACAAAGLIASVFYPPKFELPTPLRAALPAQPTRNALEAAAKAMNAAAQMLRASKDSPARELELLCENAKTQVCGNCARKETCWSDSSAIYAELAENCGELFGSGEAALAALPPAFRVRCLHPEGFVAALNEALEAARAGHRMRHRLDEARRAAKMHYEILGDYFLRLSRRLYCPEPEVNYTPEIAVKAAGRGGSRLSGDHGAAFQGPDGTYYVILCDGMGTGEFAARESLDAIRVLRLLLSAGLDAESALRSLNSMYLLRDNGCFSTVDLLRVNLTSADAILYKWGASASYLKRHRGLRALGGGNLPPGIGPDEQMEKIHFSLDHGCVIVLLSDGFGDKESLRRLESCTSLCPRDVVGSLFIGRDAPEDDCTAVALRLSASKGNVSLLQ